MLQSVKIYTTSDAPKIESEIGISLVLVLVSIISIDFVLSVLLI